MGVIRTQRNHGRDRCGADPQVVEVRTPRKVAWWFGMRAEDTRLVTKMRGGMKSGLVDFGKAFDLLRVKVMIAGQMGPI